MIILSEVQPAESKFSSELIYIQRVVLDRQMPATSS